MPAHLHHTIFPIGDAALVIDFGSTMSEETNRHVLSLFNDLRRYPVNGMIDAIPAYSSLAIYYDLYKLRKIVSPALTVYEWMCRQLEQWMANTPVSSIEPIREMRIPVCYETAFAPDITAVLEKNGLTTEELIHLHTSTTYRVYMLGFLPGFAYMGEVDGRLIMPRKSKPIDTVAGSVGIAGKQTGIYPVSSPGGWQIIGRTPIQIFDANSKEPALLQAGDSVRFYSISGYEFTHY